LHVVETATLVPNLPHEVAALAGILLLLGLWTPIAGIAIALVETWVFFGSPGHSLIPFILAGLGITVAMIGPGIWSIDARLYGRKHLQAPRR
jgi:putative oxidoreductase